MSDHDRLQLARDAYRAYASGDRELIESEFVRLLEAGDEVIVTYESTKADGRRFRNTEVLTFAGAQIRQVEVYFGWDLE